MQTVQDRDYGRIGRPVQFFEAFIQAHEVAGETLTEAGYSWDDAVNAEEESIRESATSSDFATYLNDKVTKRLMWGYNEVASNWRQYARTYNVPDFKPISFVRVSEMQDLLPVPEGGPYHDSQIDEIVGPSLSVGTFGRLFSISRRALINDDLNQLRDRPAAMGRAVRRTVSKDVIKQLTSNPNAYDGTALFHSNHGNLLALALTEDNLGTAIQKMRIQTDPNGLRIGLRPRLLVIPPELELTARRILNSTAVPQPVEGVAQTGIRYGVGGQNVLANAVDYIVEDYFTDSNDWYLFADPQEAPVLGVGFLNGVETPDIFLRDPGMRNVLGGTDPYTMYFDEIWWKCRHDWGTGVFDWRGALASIIA